MEPADAYTALHTAILSGALSPGERLVEEELAGRLGQTRGSVRAAILRLAHDGLVVRERNRGARVRRVSAKEAIEIVEARSVLESLAAGYAALRRTKDEVDQLTRLLADMHEMHRDGKLLEMSERNAILHRRVLEISRHQVALEVCGRLHSQVVRFQFRTILAPGRASLSIREHSDIVEAIVRQERRAAEDAMRRHLLHVMETLSDAIPEEGAVAL